MASEAKDNKFKENPPREGGKKLGATQAHQFNVMGTPNQPHPGELASQSSTIQFDQAMGTRRRLRYVDGSYLTVHIVGGGGVETGAEQAGYSAFVQSYNFRHSHALSLELLLASLTSIMFCYNSGFSASSVFLKPEIPALAPQASRLDLSTRNWASARRQPSQHHPSSFCPSLPPKHAKQRWWSWWSDKRLLGCQGPRPQAHLPSEYPPISGWARHSHTCMVLAAQPAPATTSSTWDSQAVTGSGRAGILSLPSPVVPMPPLSGSLKVSNH
ncbi:hypothetical protein V8F20_007787 [Naviculisporaceae sp. PSN 640]